MGTNNPIDCAMVFLLPFSDEGFSFSEHDLYSIQWARSMQALTMPSFFTVWQCSTR